MPTRDDESNIEWTFDDGWTVLKYDEWTYYVEHFQSCAHSAAVDFILVNARKTCWLLEVKDFTTDAPKREKGPLWETVTRKVRDTLAGVLAGSAKAHDDTDRECARRIRSANEFRVVFHCERPRHESRLFKDLPSAADLRQKLRSKSMLRAVDPHVLVVDCASTPSDVPWTATWSPKKRARKKKP